MSVRKIQWVRLILAFVVILSATSILLFFNIKSSHQPLGLNLDLESFMKEQNLQAKLTGIHMIEEDQGKKSWELWADNAQIYNEGDNIMLEKIKTFVYQKGTNKVEIRGEKGKVDRKTKDMELSGGVVIVNDDGSSLLTDYIKWDAQKREMHSPYPVTIKDGKMEVKGKGMVTYMDRGTLVLKKDVEAVIKQW